MRRVELLCVCARVRVLGQRIEYLSGDQLVRACAASQKRGSNSEATCRDYAKSIRKTTIGEREGGCGRSFRAHLENECVRVCSSTPAERVLKGPDLVELQNSQPNAPELTDSSGECEWVRGIGDTLHTEYNNIGLLTVW